MGIIGGIGEPFETLSILQSSERDSSAYIDPITEKAREASTTILLTRLLENTFAVNQGSEVNNSIK